MIRGFVLGALAALTWVELGRRARKRDRSGLGWAEAHDFRVVPIRREDFRTKHGGSDAG